MLQSRNCLVIPFSTPEQVFVIGKKMDEVITKHGRVANGRQLFCVDLNKIM